jgi:hypothetical protein
MVQPWAESGCKCICVDIQHSIRKTISKSFGKGQIVYEWGDIRTWSPCHDDQKNLIIIFAFPPCTHVSVSGARDFRIKGTAMLKDSLELFSACENAGKWSGVPYCIENPVGKFSDHMGKPDYLFHPWEYGDLWTKKTCLWTGNGFVMPEKTVKQKPDNVVEKIFLMKPSSKRGDIRSETPPGFSRAVFDANSYLIN